MTGIDRLLLIPEPSWLSITGLEDILNALDIPTERGCFRDLAPEITPFDFASLRAFLDGNALVDVDDPTPVELDYEKRLWRGDTQSIGGLYNGPGYCSRISENMLKVGGTLPSSHPIIITPRILVEYTDRVHARTFFAFWPTVVSVSGMRTALLKDQEPLSEYERDHGMVKNILSSLLHVYCDEQFRSDPSCFHSNPHTISEVRERNQSTGLACDKHKDLLLTLFVL